MMRAPSPPAAECGRVKVDVSQPPKYSWGVDSCVVAKSHAVKRRAIPDLGFGDELSIRTHSPKEGQTHSDLLGGRARAA